MVLDNLFDRSKIRWSSYSLLKFRVGTFTSYRTYFNSASFFNIVGYIKKNGWYQYAGRSKDIASHEMGGLRSLPVLINSEINTVDEFVTCCREVDAMRKKRVVPLRYERQPKVLHPSQRQMKI
ncbi:hypothetical protein TNCV_4085481 [Trichonephila clavipes]|nr:hypothetical protein TNCV_4085481 [Trichonephila clavipes]